MTDDTTPGQAIEADEGNPLFASLVQLADTLVTGFDVMDVADHLVTSALVLLPITQAGILLDDQRGSLRVLASSSEETRSLELLELQSDEGPCLEAFRTGRPVSVIGQDEIVRRWPALGALAAEQQVQASFAFPMRLRERTIGAINLFSDHPAALTLAEHQVATVLSSMATIGILNHRTVRAQEILAQQLQTALNSRITIEQAKGVIAERAGVDMKTAFEMLRKASRSSRRSLSELAAEVVAGRGLSAAAERPHQ